MRALDLIIKKRDHGELTPDEIEFFVQGLVSGDIPDYQVSAWAMAVLLNGMSDRETTALTLAMAHSGEMLNLEGVVPTAVDKHSTGGVGDKTTLVVEPMVAACGLPVGKMSGRGLGFSGGTLDKIEAIPGYRTDLTRQEFISQLSAIGLVLTGQSIDFAPADGKLYALRDVTGTVQSIPLIASSVMCKKIAAGAQAIVLDVKCGLGAFMESLEDARQLARLMVSIGKISGRKVVAIISNMNQPLGFAVGNALEIREAIDTLQGHGPADFIEHCLIIASHMLHLGGKAASVDECRLLAKAALESGKALDQFCKLVQAQGGDVTYVYHPEKLAVAHLIETVTAEFAGFVAGINAREVGETAVDLGAGRTKKGEKIDPAVGIIIHHKVGDWVEIGAPVFTVHANSSIRMAEAKKRLHFAHSWSSTPVPPLPLILDVITV